ncbi:hypothetical protein [Herpetosiphon gulosus]|uniref:Gustatory receptor n=1 Tax=Herpetosiphon gulosus TaxID=1973496 RepID=A0ABP9XAC0_9CHLR
MTWVIFCTIITYIATIYPIIYSLRYVHKTKGIMRLWGYAPNQFLFMVIVFPIVTFLTFLSLRYILIKLISIIPSNYSLIRIYDEWILSLIFGIIISGIITIAVYTTSSFSLDKLEPLYATRAMNAITSINEDINLVEKDKRESYRDKIINDAKQKRRNITLPNSLNSADIALWVENLEDDVFLQIIREPKSPIRLRLVNNTLYNLTVIQTFITILVCVYILFSAFLCIHAAKELNYDGKNLPELTVAIESVFYSLVFISLYPIFYRQYRTELEAITGSGTTVLQDIITGILITSLLIWIKSLDPSNRELNAVTIVKYIPVAVIGSTMFSGIIDQDTMKQLIGSDSRLGIQVILIVIFLIFSIIPIYHILSRN